MSIKRSLFSPTILVVPNSEYFFGQLRTTEDLLKIVRKFDCAGVATVLVTGIGTFGFAFPSSSPLASIEKLEFVGSGPMPDEVTDNQHSIDKLQEQRMLFINFISAAFFGRVCAKGHTGLTGAVYSGQDRVTAFDVHDISLIVQPEPMIIRALEEKTRTFNAGNYSHRLLGDAQIDDAILYVQHLLQRQQDFQYADLCSCIVMNYQAAILHHRQHASASLALNFSVTECLIREIFMAYGLVSGSTAKPFATRTHNIKTMSKSAFDRMTSDKLLRILYDGGLINNKYLYERLDSARRKRNALMHKGETISSRDSGDCQTLVRDLWAFVVDTPFELIMPWSYRR